MTKDEKFRSKQEAKVLSAYKAFGKAVFRSCGLPAPLLKAGSRGVGHLLYKDPILDTYEAAEVLGLAKHTLDNWRTTGKGPMYIRVGNRIRYRKSSLDEFLSKNRQWSTSESGDLE